MSDSSNDNDRLDPEIEELLKFEPVPRQREVEGGWTPELQRKFIARLAVHGSANKACEEMGKNRTGITKLYRSPMGASFRSAWDGAVALARRRRAERDSALEPVSPGTMPPTLDHRRKSSPERGGGPAQLVEGPEISEDQKWELMHGIGLKFMRLVAAERQARLAGEIVAADFYLRQVTFIEVTLDLAATNLGFDPQEVLRELRRGEHGLLDIASTWLSDWMDRSRRLWWAQEGEPARPPHPDVRFLERHGSADGDYATQAEMYACHGMRPPPGVSVEEWHAMTKDQQQALIDRVRMQDAEDQRAWEEAARRDFESRRDSAT